MPNDTLTRIAELADSWSDERDDRLRRRELDRADFDAVAATGYLALIVPEQFGGSWRSLADTGPLIVEAIGRLATADPSLALVASMHPAVLGFWLPDAPVDHEHRESWEQQRAEVFGSALDGHFWGTLTSEPGSGGDVLATRVRAVPDADGCEHRLFGDKHFGSGSGIASYMITTARPEGADLPLGYVLDLREQPWDGSAGVEITRPWDGMGMKATQSHAVHFDGVPATPWAWQEAIAVGGPTVQALGLSLFCSVIVAVCDSAVAEARRRLTGRQLRPFEEVGWTQVEIDHWMLTQAFDGLIRALQTEPPEQILVTSTKAKMGLADLAESLLSTLCRVVGGGAFSASSPFSSWYEDVRALGYLRPPWGLAFDQLAAARRGADSAAF